MMIKRRPACARLRTIVALLLHRAVTDKIRCSREAVNIHCASRRFAPQIEGIRDRFLPFSMMIVIITSASLQL